MASEPASPRWDRNKYDPEYQEGAEYNPELAAIRKEELELNRKYFDENYPPTPLARRRKMSWE
ncbi:MAG TPA: hypothetical protein VJB38_12380 [Bacteroidota bacterium]|nr:hypothetical protein [Bacteroidota bacterium]